MRAFRFAIFLIAVLLLLAWYFSIPTERQVNEASADIFAPTP